MKLEMIALGTNDLNVLEKSLKYEKIWINMSLKIGKISTQAEGISMKFLKLAIIREKNSKNCE